LNLLFNNAGVMNKSIESIVDFTKEDMMHHFEVNTVSPVLLTQAFLPLLKQAAAASPGGPVTKSAVVFVSSLLGCFFPNIPKYFVYRYSKAALNMATHCLAMELKPEGVLVMAVHPGHVKTDMGGPNGAIEKEASASGLINVITGLEEKHRGKLYQWDGKELGW
jgi:NAD(P)-dependent dehydrogenase (short-subunit alcohol dehydrogenase family)